LNHRYLGLALGAAALVAAPASARMPATQFLKRADGLRAKGPFAFLSADLKTLQAEAETAGDELHAEHVARLAAHEPTDWCAPANKYLAPRELIVGMHEISRAELEQIDIKQAMRLVFKRNYPCPR